MRRKLFGVLIAVGLVASTSSPLFAQEGEQGPVVLPTQPTDQVSETGQTIVHEPFTANGTLQRVVYTVNAADARDALISGEASRLRTASDPEATPYGLFLQTNTIGEPSYIVLDLSWLRDSDFGPYSNLDVPRQLSGQYESVSVHVVQQPDDTFLAIQYQDLSKGSMVNNTDWGIQEEWTTRDDSINARVGNVPDDDEALAQRGEDDEDD